jgi:glutamate dehydrogenase (NADP+)
LGGKPISASDSNGSIVDLDGICAEKLKHIMEIKNVNRDRIVKYLEKYPNAKYYDK